MRLIRLIIVTILLLSFVLYPLSGSAAEISATLAQHKQEKIDLLFTELNNLAAEDRTLSFLNSKEYAINVATIDASRESIDNRRTSVEQELESLGVNIIDPTCAEDISHLEEVVLGNKDHRNIPDPPDLEAFADCYTIAQYDGTINVDGATYRYSYLYVTDNKGYEDSPLTESQQVNELIGKERTILGDMLKYQFSFGLSSYLGFFPGGWAIDWTIGTITSIFDSINKNSLVTYNGNSSIYNMSMLSVTQMMYCYFYLPDAGWILCGVKAPSISYTRAEYIIANVNGAARSDAVSYPTLISTTGRTIAEYISEYTTHSICWIDEIGFLTVNTYEGELIRFTPGFAHYPIDLLC